MGATILCVDDDRHLCRILEKALGREGYSVVTAHDGDEALDRVEDARPELVLLDVLLPRRDGFEVLEAMRQSPTLSSQPPVLMMTGCRVTPQYEERAARLGAAAILAKPVPLDTLLGRVREQVKESPPPVRPGARKPRRSNGARAAAARAGSTPSRSTRARPRKAARSKAEPMSGSFRELGFPHLLHHLHGLRATGVLLLSNGKKRKAVQLRDGYPVAVKSNLINECLGNQLMKRGVIDDASMRESLQRVKKGEGLQGEILVAMDLLTEDEMVRALREQAEEKLFEVFAWRRGQFQFEIGGRLKRGNELALEDSPANLILRGVRRYMPLDHVDAFLSQRRGRYLVAGESPFYRHQDIHLDAAERQLLASLGSGRPLASMLEQDEGLRRTLFGLIATEVIDLREAADSGGQAAQPEGPPEPPASSRPDPERDRELRTELAARAETLRGMSYFEMLGVSEQADPETITAAYDELAVQTHPDRFASASSAVRQLADQVHQLIARAHATLTDPKRRREYEVERKKGERKAAQKAEGRRALDAEIEFQKGESNLRSRDYEIALRYFGAALSKYPEEGEYHSHYGWCLHLCHPDDPTIAQEAIEHAKRGAKLARDREKPYLFLGRLYKVVGKAGMAEKMFTRAVQIRPDCVEALRELRLINLRREKSRGIVRRLLRR
ncbi:MAG: response regulator [Myxococcota bacterium]